MRGRTPGGRRKQQCPEVTEDQEAAGGVNLVSTHLGRHVGQGGGHGKQGVELDHPLLVGQDLPPLLQRRHRAAAHT